MSVLLQDLANQTQDFVMSYSTTTLPQPNLYRGINRAIEFVQRRLGLPSDNQIQSFYFYEDTDYYATNPDFNELIGLKYNVSSAPIPLNGDPNVPRNRWNLYKDIEIAQLTGSWPDENQVAWTTMNGSSQFLLHGKNLHGRYVMNSFSNTGGITASSDVSSFAQDVNVYKYGNASVAFNIASGLSATSFSFTGLWSIQNLFNLNGAYRMYVDFPVGTTGYFSNVTLQLKSSSGNYYSMSTTTNSDGSAWNSGNWSLLSWFLSNATITGNPNPQLINQVTVIFNHSGTFAPVTNMRLNYLYQINPDYMDAVYYSNYKGTDTTGATKKTILNIASDITYFGSYAPDLQLPISLKAATYLSPQILADPNFRTIWLQDFVESMEVFGRVYPRRRATGQFGATSIRR